MPIYEYECKKCKNVVEEFFPSIPREIPEEILLVCNVCNVLIRPFKRVLSKPNFHLKGGGWAKDGYSSDYQDGSKVVSLEEPK